MLFGLFSRKKQKHKKEVIVAQNSIEYDVEELPYINVSRALPTDINDFRQEHFKVLRRLNKHPAKESFSGMIALEVDIPNFIPILQKLNLIRLATYSEALQLTKIDILKQILRNNKLKISGNKNELIKRIYDNIPEENARSIPAYSDFFILTPEGHKAIEESYSKFDRERSIFFEECISLILKGRIDFAYRKICKRNAEMPVSPGIGIDWSKRYYEGLNEDKLIIFSRLLEESDNKTVTASAIFSTLSGDTLNTVASCLVNYVRNETSEKELLLSRLYYEASIISGEFDTNEYIRAGIEEYQFLATLDERTCPVCGNLDGQIFPLSQKKIGVNFPPMHEKCRCTTISVVNREWLEKQTRSARDPVTGKSIDVPMTMNYQQWKDMYM